jgi:hypothetical protein
MVLIIWQSSAFLQAMPVVSVGMNLAVSEEDFYEVKDTFISNIASVLGINPSRISIVDIVPGNARRAIDVGFPRRGSSNASAPGRSLLGAGISVEIEIGPGAVIDVNQTAVSFEENAGVIDVYVKRTTNFGVNCSVEFTVTTIETTTAVAGTHFTPVTGTVSFEAGEREKAISVDIASVAGFSAEDVTFAVELFNATNADLGETTTVVSVRNVHAPAPTGMVLESATVESVTLTWTSGSWPNPPENSTILSYTVECKKGSGDWESPVSVEGGEQGRITVTDLVSYQEVVCRVRAYTSEDGDWGTSPIVRSLR